MKPTVTEWALCSSESVTTSGTITKGIGNNGPDSEDKKVPTDNILCQSTSVTYGQGEKQGAISHLMGRKR
jgi:hypothetical protein